MPERNNHTRIQGVRLAAHPPTLAVVRPDTEYEPRQRHLYTCTLGHETTVVFHAVAVPPPVWDCAVCPSVATHETAADGEAAEPARRPKTHLEQLHSRRSEEELEALLSEALSNYRTFGKAF